MNKTLYKTYKVSVLYWGRSFQYMFSHENIYTYYNKIHTYIHQIHNNPIVKHYKAEPEKSQCTDVGNFEL